MPGSGTEVMGDVEEDAMARGDGASVLREGVSCSFFSLGVLSRVVL